MPSRAFGLDFGTSKTAVTLAQTGSINPPVVEVTIDGYDRIASCFLRDNSRGGRIYLGQKAEEQNLMTDPSVERSPVEFFANFKPHIHQSEADREAARIFLEAVRSARGLSQEINRFSGDAVLAVGCPVAWAHEGAETLLRILRQAKFPPAFAIPEPVGATFHFLGTRLRAQDFHHDIVVFDWGAGTFDMTVLRARRLEYERQNSWGSTLYGGRLFDDLFYQWLLDTARACGRGSDVDRLASETTDRAILLGLICRDIKERFSRSLGADGPEEPWAHASPVSVGSVDLGRFRVERSGEFFERMLSYRASDVAREWIAKAGAEALPEEQRFADALRDGQPVNLEAWGRMLIDEGLAKLSVGDKAVAILTGGSTNWKWFQDEICGHDLFRGRSEEAVLYDEKPELTIARGLARAYSIGSYSRKLIGDLAARREELALRLQTIHEDLLRALSDRLAGRMSTDLRLRADIRRIFAQSLERAAMSPPAPPSAVGWFAALWEKVRRLFAEIARGFSRGSTASLKDHQERIKGAIQEMLKDPQAEAVRPALEARVREWIAANRDELVALDRQISADAHQEVMALVKQYLEIHGLVEVAIEACGATGATTFDLVLRELGNKVDFGPGVIERFSDWLGVIVRTTREGPMAAKPDLDEQANASTTRFFAALPAAIRTNVAQVQSAESWKEGILADLERTLETLIRVAGVPSDAPANAPLEAPPPTPAWGPPGPS
ncbi:MAG TPA: Hsp70 family protein [Xanthobacteraceae bacterium]|nr:Hsp70 family protein [Xanthobacteraceae bacterium]